MFKLDLVIEGGGTKIPAIVGAVKRLYELGWRFQKVAGSSAGAIVSSLIAAGYTPYELEEIIFNTDFNKFKNGSYLANIQRLVSKYGFFSGDSFLKYMKDLLEAKNVTTFQDLKIPLKVLAADLSYADIAIFPDHARIYNIEPEELEVATAVRASMAIPLVFEPVKLNNRYLVDGGTVSNFPIWIFDRPNPEYPTFGLLLKENDFHVNHKVNSIVDFAYATLRTATQGREKIAMHPGDFVSRIISIDVGKASALNFNMSLEEQKQLTLAGSTAVDRFLSQWDWEKYLSWRINGTYDQ